MDEQRLRKIERIRAVQEKMHQLAEAKLAALNREQTANAQDQESLVGAFNRDDPLHGAFVEAMARRLATLTREAAQIQAAREAQNRALTEAGLKLRRTEKMNERVRRQVRAELGKRTFADLLDTLAKARDASLP
jgi:hypothetical protein